MKQHRIIIETPEKIRFHYEIAQLGTRIAAYILDFILQLILYAILISLIFSGIFGFNSDNWNSLVMTFVMLMIFFLKWGYFVLCEVLMEGQSPGKKAMRIRVIRSNGEALDIKTIILRNLVRAVDGMPALPLVGGFVALLDKYSRRLGDILADTLVVKEIYFDLKEPHFQVQLTQPENNESLQLHHSLNEKQLYILRRFLNDRHQLPPAKQAEIAEKLVREVQNTLQIKENNDNPILFLEKVYQQHGTENEK